MAQVRQPNWQGVDGEAAVVVRRGEPRRSDLEMERAVAHQVREYLDHFTKVKVNPMLVALTTQLIAGDYITVVGGQGVFLSREHLLKFVEVARIKLSDLEADDAQA